MIFHGVSMRYFRLAIRLLAFAPLAFGPLALSPSRLSSQGRRPLAIEDYYRIKTVGGVSLSPDGKFVAFTVSTRLEENNGNAVEAWLVPWDGSTPAKRISADGASVTGLSWDGAGMLRFNAAGSAWVVMNPAVPEATKYTAHLPAKWRRVAGAAVAEAEVELLRPPKWRAPMGIRTSRFAMFRRPPAQRQCRLSSKNVMPTASRESSSTGSTISATAVPTRCRTWPTRM
jgi:hypothetical protein